MEALMPTGTPFPLAPQQTAKAVRSPAWRIVIDGRDVSRDITPVVLSVTYEDIATAASDSIEIVVADVDGRWRDAWYPTKSDRVELWMGYDGEPLLPCGRFEIDEIQLQGPPDTLSIKALASGIIPDLRTKRSAGHEGKTLEQIVQTVAARHQFTVVGTIDPIVIERSTQRHEDDLTYLTRLSERYGYVFSVRGSQLVFHSVATLTNTPPTLIVKRTDVKRHSMKDKVLGSFVAVDLTEHDPKGNVFLHVQEKAPGVSDAQLQRSLTQGAAASSSSSTETFVGGSDVLQISDVGARTMSEAMAIARARLAAANRTAAAGSISVEGDTRLVSGTTLALAKDWGRLAGNYSAVKAAHRLTKADGYTTSAELERVVEAGA